MKQSKHLLITTFTLIFFVLVLVFGIRNNRTEKITIGFFGPLTGDLANLGEGARNGVELALQVSPRSDDVRVVFEDSACDAKSAVNAARKLIDIDKVDVLVGGLCSSETLAVAPLAEERKIPMISYCSSSPEVTNAGEYVYRLYPSDSFQGKFIAEYFARSFQNPRLAILHIQDDWGRGIYQTFMKHYQGEVVFDSQFSPETTDFRTELIKMKEQNSSIIFFIGQTSVTVPFLKQLRSFNIPAVVFGGDVWADEAVIQLPDAEGAHYSVPVSSWSEEFSKQYKEKFGKEPVVCAPQAHDAIGMIYDARRKNIPLKPYLDTIREYPGASGTITLDENGDVLDARYEVRQIKNGKSVVVP